MRLISSQQANQIVDIISFAFLKYYLILPDLFTRQVKTSQEYNRRVYVLRCVKVWRGCGECIGLGEAVSAGSVVPL